jgi:hypothetical protein
LRTLSAAKPSLGAKKEMPPPKVTPPTAVLGQRPTGIPIPVPSSLFAAACHVLPGPILTVFRSADSCVSLIFDRSMLTPSSMLFAPAKDMCPPDLTAKGHAGRSEVAADVKIVMTVDTSAALAGCTIHLGAKTAVFDHRWLLACVYSGVFEPKTLPGRIVASLEHLLHCQLGSL